MSDHLISELLRDCTLCPRQCHANRLAGQTGYCGQTAAIKAARAALHFWEEPCISGTQGSGTVFFSGCNLRCVFCQNYNIANGSAGQEITQERLTAIFLELQAQGAHNINLVTPSHAIPQIVCALQNAKKQGLDIPVVYNTGGYEEVSSLKLLDGLVDIYLPDLKYVSSELSARFSHAPDYFEKASAALAEMFRQVGTPVFSEPYRILKRGMIVRHLVLPGQTKDSKKVLRFLHETYGDNIYVSILNQYTPIPYVTDMSELNRHVTDEEYDRVLRFAERLGIRNGFIQEGEAAAESFIPEFDCRGL
ncbi:MAG: radical SAM protein [Lachnospiraceae bacterium]|nr:radical SAM protein [Lachnospiraceae bacterium]